jgi:hypothetical protein
LVVSIVASNVEPGVSSCGIVAGATPVSTQRAVLYPLAPLPM